MPKRIAAEPERQLVLILDVVRCNRLTPRSRPFFAGPWRLTVHREYLRSCGLSGGLLLEEFNTRRIEDCAACPELGRLPLAARETYRFAVEVLDGCRREFRGPCAGMLQTTEEEGGGGCCGRYDRCALFWREEFGGFVPVLDIVNQRLKLPGVGVAHMAALYRDVEAGHDLAHVAVNRARRATLDLKALTPLDEILPGG